MPYTAEEKISFVTIIRLNNIGSRRLLIGMSIYLFICMNDDDEASRAQMWCSSSSSVGLCTQVIKAKPCRRERRLWVSPAASNLSRNAQMRHHLAQRGLKSWTWRWRPSQVWTAALFMAVRQRPSCHSHLNRSANQWNLIENLKQHLKMRELQRKTT